MLKLCPSENKARRGASKQQETFGSITEDFPNTSFATRSGDENGE
jgi:hypothetical protein